MRGLVGCGCVSVMLLTVGGNRAASQNTQANDEQVIRILDNDWSKMADAHDLDNSLTTYAETIISARSLRAVANVRNNQRNLWLNRDQFN
jgi:hypothetical protein